MRQDFERAAIRERRSGPRGVLGGLIRMPHRPRELLDQPVDLPRERRRGHASGEQAQAFTLLRLQTIQYWEEDFQEHLPGRDGAVLQHGARAVGIVEGEHGSLGEHVGSA